MLRRGPLLAPILQHPDDIDFLRCLFLNANSEDGLRLLDPPLYSIMSPTEWIPLSAEDLSLQSNFILLLDHHTDMFLWIGSAVKEKGKEFLEPCRKQGELISRYRLPQPKFMSSDEGSSMARCVQCRLIPSHKDSLEEQKKSFPQIVELSQQEYQLLMKKFHRTDEISYNQYLRSILQ